MFRLQVCCSDHVGTTTAYLRASEAALSSQTASWAVSGSPTPIEQELAAGNAAYASVMFGTNDLWYGGTGDYVDLKYTWFGANMWQIVDDLIAAGTIPILSSIPPRPGDPPWAGPLVPGLNDVVRGLAEGRQVPFMDLYGTLYPIPDQGLGDDGIHLNRMDYNGTCDFTPAGLDYGYNNRNLLTLEALDRAYRVTRDFADEALEPGEVAPLAGAGTASDPFVIDAVPFTHMMPRVATEHALGADASCVSGGEGAVYRLDVDTAEDVRVVAVTPDFDTPVGLTAVARGGSSPTCLTSRDRMLELHLGAGHYDLIVERVPASIAEVLLVVSPLP